MFQKSRLGFGCRKKILVLIIIAHPVKNLYISDTSTEKESILEKCVKNNPNEWFKVNNYTIFHSPNAVDIDYDILLKENPKEAWIGTFYKYHAIFHTVERIEMQGEYF